MTRKEIKALSKSKLKGRWLNIVLLTLIIAIIELVASEIVQETDGMLSSILSIANSFLLMPCLTASGIIYTIKFVKEKEKVALKEAIPSVRTWGRFILNMLVLIIFGIPILLVAFLGNIFLFMSITSLHTSMLTGAITINPMIIIWGIAILIILVVLFLTMIMGILLFPMPYIMAEEPLGVFDAIRKSFSIMKGHKIELFVLGLSFIGWGLLSLLTLGIGFLWLLPYIQVTLRVYYLSITEREDELK